VICVANKIDVDLKVTERSFAFPQKRKMPFFFASAADGTNVVQIFEKAMELGAKCKANPPKDFMAEVQDLLGEDF
jgi:Rab-like protein 2